MTTEKLNEQWLSEARAKVHTTDNPPYCDPPSNQHTLRCNIQAMKLYRQIEADHTGRDSFQEELLGSMRFAEEGHSRVLDAIKEVLRGFHERRPKDLTERETKLLAAIEVLAAYGHGPAIITLKRLHRDNEAEQVRKACKHNGGFGYTKHTAEGWENWCSLCKSWLPEPKLILPKKKPRSGKPKRG